MLKGRSGSLVALVMAVFVAGVSGCSNDPGDTGNDECGPNHACPVGFTCDEAHEPTRCIASQTPDKVTFSLAIAGGGTVTVTGSDACTKSSCSYSLNQGSSVMLTATPAAGSLFVSWSGDCSGTTPTITLALDAARSCTASFAVIDSTRFTVSVSASAPAGGTVSTTPALTCTGGTCSGSVASGTSISLSAVAATGFRFTGWSGSAACDGKTDSPLAFEVTADLSCSAGFVKRVTVTGAIQSGLDGAVTATAADASSTCTGAACVADIGHQVTLVAPTIGGHRLTGWTGAGCDAGTASGSGLTLTATSDITCTATYALGVSVSGTVVGAVGQVSAASTSANAQCASGSCAIDQGGNVTLTAPDLAPASRFLGWSGDAVCTGTTLALSLTNVQSSVSCRAGYVARRKATGTMQAGVAGAVAASSTDAAASCSGNTCTVDSGGAVTLKAPTVAGSRFLGWTGAGCTGSSATLVVHPIDADVTCRTRYATEVTVTATVAGATATVSASSTSPGAMCTGASCTLDSGGSVTLTAPDLAPDLRFGGWSGDAGCTGTDRAITLGPVTQATTCTATYVGRVVVGVALAAGVPGAATVTSDDPNKVCDATACTIDGGRSVTIGAPDAAGFRFTGWSPAACGSSQSSTFAPTGDTTCTAQYTRRFTIAAVAGANGSVSAAAGGQACSNASCTVDAGIGVTLTATASGGFHFGGWAGAGCTPAASNPLVLTDVNATCTASFAANPTFTASGVTSPAGVIAITATAPAGTCANGRCTAVPSGTQVTFAFNAGALPRNVHFVDWSANCRGPAPAPSATVTVTADITCTAQFRIDVTGVTSPAHGTLVAVPASCPQGGTISTCAVDPGTTVSFTVTPQSGWRFFSWTGARCVANGTTATVTAAMQPTTCTANLVSTSWSSAYGEVGGHPAQGTGLVQITPTTFAVAASSSLNNNAARWVVPLDVSDGTDVTPAQFTGAALDPAIGTAAPPVPLPVAASVAGDFAWVTGNSDGKLSPVVVRYSLAQGQRFAVVLPFVQTGFTTSLAAPVALGGSAQNLWVASEVKLGSPAGAAGQEFARVSQVSSTGTLTADFRVSLRSNTNTSTCPAPAPDLPTTATGLADVGDGLVLAITDSPSNGKEFVVVKTDYIGTVLWANRVRITNAFGLNPPRVIATSGGGAVVIGSHSDDGAKEDAFYVNFTRTGAAGFTGGFYGQSLNDGNSKCAFSAAAVDRGGGLAFAGRTADGNDTPSTRDAWLVIVGANGAVTQQRAYGGSAEDHATGLGLPSDGGYLVTGETSSFGGTDVWAFRTDDAMHVAFTAASGGHEVATTATQRSDLTVTGVTCTVSSQRLLGNAATAAALAASALAPVVTHQAP